MGARPVTARCRSCQAPIVWVESEATEMKPAKKLPLDADPKRPHEALRVSNGNIVFAGATSGDGTPIVRYQRNGAHRSHFATCKQSKSWRRS